MIARTLQQELDDAKLSKNEMWVHYSECLEWVAALTWFIKEHGLAAPQNWGDMYAAGFKHQPEEG